MSIAFKCLDWENKKQVTLEGSISATGEQAEAVRFAPRKDC